jgi:hypothetical protein
MLGENSGSRIKMRRARFRLSSLEPIAESTLRPVVHSIITKAISSSPIWMVRSEALRVVQFVVTAEGPLERTIIESLVTNTDLSYSVLSLENQYMLRSIRPRVCTVIGF